jgi:hypothetical protein
MEAAILSPTVAFPEDWDAPVEANGTHYFDPMHFPFPICPLTISAHGPAFGVGFAQAAQEYHVPFKRVVVLARNLYRFEWHEMDIPASADEARRVGEAAEAAVKMELGRLLERWEAEHLPAIRAHISRLREMDIERASAAEVALLLDEADAIHRDVWLIHFRIAIPMLGGIQVFDEFYADVFGGEGDGHALLVGVESESVKAGLGLYDLAVRAKDLGLAPVFRDTPSDELLGVLEGTEAGRAFLGELRAYLDEYGLRQDLFDLMTPTWLEDPTFALSSVRNYIQAGRDERAAYAAKQQAAEEALAAARAELAAYPEAVRGQFEGAGLAPAALHADRPPAHRRGRPGPA